MSKSTGHSRLSSTATTPDVDLSNIQLQTLLDLRQQTNDKRLNNVNYVRHVLRKFFGNYIRKPSTSNATGFDDVFAEASSPDTLISPILTHPCLHYDKHAKFSGRPRTSSSSPRLSRFRRTAARLAPPSLRAPLGRHGDDQARSCAMLHLSSLSRRAPIGNAFGRRSIPSKEKQRSPPPPPILREIAREDHSLGVSEQTVSARLLVDHAR